MEKGQKREYGKGTLTIKDDSCPLFKKIPAAMQVWNSHGDKLTKLPKGFEPVARTENWFAAVLAKSKLLLSAKVMAPSNVLRARRPAAKL